MPVEPRFCASPAWTASSGWTPRASALVSKAAVARTTVQSPLTLRADVKRAEAVSVEGVDRSGKPVKIDAEGLLAIVLQHEIDHLEGMLFIDRISPLKRQLYKRRVMKQLKKQ